MLNNALTSESVPKPIPARLAPITVPTPSAPQGTAHWPQLARTAALKGVNPAASRIGALMTTATPNPVTDSKNGATPPTTPPSPATPHQPWSQTIPDPSTPQRPPRKAAQRSISPENLP